MSSVSAVGEMKNANISNSIYFQFLANQEKKILNLFNKQQGLVILSYIRPVCQLCFFPFILLINCVSVHMQAHATLDHSVSHIFCILFSPNQPWASGYLLCFVFKLCTDMHTMFHRHCFLLFTVVDVHLHVKAGGCGKMSSRSDFNAIYSIWLKLYSSIVAIDRTDNIRSYCRG